MSRYERYKDSGIEWIGEIPAHWDRTKLKHLVITKITDGPHETPEFISDGIPFLSAEAIKNNELDFTAKRGSISRETFYLYNKKSQVKKDDILFCKSGSTTGKSAMVKTDIEFGIWSPLAIIRANRNKIDQDFLFYFIQCKNFQIQVKVFWTFGTQPNIGMGTLENLYTAFPKDVLEQYKIADYLDAKTKQIEKLIADKYRLVELLKEELSAFINFLLNETEKKYHGVKLKYCVGKVGSGITPKGGANVYLSAGIPLLRSQNIYNEGLVLNDVAFISDVIDEEMSNSRIKEGDVLLNITGASIGRCYFVPKEFGKGNVNQHVCILRPDSSKIITEYLHSFLISEIGQRLIDSYQNGANREGLNFQQIKSFKIPLPNLSEQNIIVQEINQERSRTKQVISKIENEISLIQEYRTSLISEVVTGKIKVSNADITVIIPSKQTALAAEIMSQLYEEKSFGRVKFQKILYLCQYAGYLEGFDSNYKRAAAGPLDNDLLTDIEKELRQLQWIDTVSAPSNQYKERIIYSPLSKLQEYQKWYAQSWSDKNEEIQHIVGLLRFANTEKCEMIATLFAAWNDLIIKGNAQPDDDVIIQEVFDWHVSKKRLPKEDWQKELNFMRKQHIVPTGFGKLTIAA